MQLCTKWRQRCVAIMITGRCLTSTAEIATQDYSRIESGTQNQHREQLLENLENTQSYAKCITSVHPRNGSVVTLLVCCMVRCMYIDRSHSCSTTVLNLLMPKFLNTKSSRLGRSQRMDEHCNAAPMRHTPSMAARSGRPPSSAATSGARCAAWRTSLR